MNILTSQDRIVLVGDDFNLVFNNDIDSSAYREGGVGALTREDAVCLQEMGLVDLWREHHPHAYDYTFYSHTHKSYACLDHFLGSREVQRLVKSVKIDQRSLSDHSVLVLELHSARVGDAPPQ